MESVQVRIASFIESGGRPRDMLDKAAAFVRELEGLKAQAVEIGQEEAKVDGHTSGALLALVSYIFLRNAICNHRLAPVSGMLSVC